MDDERKIKVIAKSMQAIGITGNIMVGDCGETYWKTVSTRKEES